MGFLKITRYFLSIMAISGLAIAGQNDFSEPSCGNCHQDKIDSGAAHFIKSSEDCYFCHAIMPTQTISGRHEIITLKTNDACQACHNAQGTVTAIGHENLACADCHNPHGSAIEPNLGRPVIELCSESCHTSRELGRSHPIGTGVIDKNTGTTMTCTSTCHNIHNPKEAGKLLQAAALDLCHSCHGNKF